MNRGTFLVLVLALALIGLPHAARTAEDAPSSWDVDVRGLVDARLALSSDTISWEQAGLGKVRYGAAGDAVFRPRVEGAMVIQPRLGFSWSGMVHLSANTEQRTALDVVEAYVAYDAPPIVPVGIRGKAGAFFPPISMENTGLAWTSPYSISSSAINTWVGEELRTLGGEATVFARTANAEAGVTGALYAANDPVGTLLAWRGWTISDREVGLFDRIPLPNVRLIRPGGVLPEQVPWEEPFHELDDRLGYYVGAHARHEDFGEISVLKYDNKADDRADRNGQWAWRTRFWSAGYRSPRWASFTLLAQVMKGSTSVITIRPPTGPIVYATYWSAFALVSRDWDRHRLSLRVERFGADDRDIFPDNNNEHGTGVTLGYIFRPTDRQRLTLEFLHVDSHRPERQYLGFPQQAGETLIQASYRLSFGTDS